MILSVLHKIVPQWKNHRESESMPSGNHKWRGAVVVCGLWILGVCGAFLIGLSDSDLAWTSHFYHSDGNADSWSTGKNVLFSALYKYGELPGIILAVLSTLGCLMIRLGRMDRRYTRPFLVIILTVILGPGLVVNGILKEHWGRPRPADLQQFGATEHYRHFWNPGGRGCGKSFVCGHCAIAFSTCSVVALYPIHPVVASAGLVTGIVYGVLMSLARISQGGHFSTDAVWSATIVLSLIAFLYYFVFRIPEQYDRPRH